MNFQVNNIEDFKIGMQQVSKNNKGLFTASITFGTVFVKNFKFPSQIGSAQIDGSPGGFKGFWKDGNFVPFSKDFIQKKNKPKKKKFSGFGGG